MLRNLNISSWDLFPFTALANSYAICKSAFRMFLWLYWYVLSVSCCINVYCSLLISYWSCFGVHEDVTRSFLLNEISSLTSCAPPPDIQATGLNCATYAESWPILDEILQEKDQSSPVYMYCTGGIRCEKASVYLKAKGFQNVFQLQVEY